VAAGRSFAKGKVVVKFCFNSVNIT